MSRLTLGLFALALVLGGWIGRLEAGIMDSVNASDSPAAGHYDTATDVGWYYAPSSGYVLNGIDTKFGAPTDGRTITVEIFDGFPTPAGPLRQASFIPSGGGFEGGTFSPLTLTAGHQYFVGFENVSGFPLNVTQGSGATSLGSLYFDTDHSNLFTGGHDPADYFTSQPILEFLGPASVPEPSSAIS